MSEHIETYNLEQTIIKNIITNESYMRKVIPFLKTEYFEGNYRLLFKQLCKYVSKYNKLPTQEAFKIELDGSDIFTEELYSQSLSILSSIFVREEVDEKWLCDKTEEWCQERAIHIAIMDSISIIDGKHKSLKKDAIPSLLSSALSVGFDRAIGHDYIKDFEARFDYYHTEENKVPFDLELFNVITNGGLPNKTLTIVLAGTNVGKSLFLCHYSASCLSMGYNVLYITAEMSEEKIAARIDANILDVPIDQLKNLSKSMFEEKINKLKLRTNGTLIIKEYPTGQPNTSHFRALINDLKLKKQFVPQVIVIDYLNICASARLKSMGGAINSYSYFKAIAEEFRGLAVEFDVPIISATQTNRSGYTNSDPGLEDTSESFGLPATADLMFALVTNEELEKSGQILVKQLKNRDNDVSKHKRFVIGINRLHMRLFDIDISHSKDLVSDVDSSRTSEITDPRLSGVKEFKW